MVSEHSCNGGFCITVIRSLHLVETISCYNSTKRKKKESILPSHNSHYCLFYSARWIGNHGFSIGIDDVQPGKELVEKKRMEIEKGYGMCEAYIASYNNGELELKPGCDAAQTLEAHITNELNDIREKTGQVRLPVIWLCLL